MLYMVDPVSPHRRWHYFEIPTSSELRLLFPTFHILLPLILNKQPHNGQQYPCESSVGRYWTLRSACDTGREGQTGHCLLVSVLSSNSPRDDVKLIAMGHTGNFYIVNQIIERGLHTSDDEVKLYTTDLVDKLEQVRSISHIPRPTSTSVSASPAPWNTHPRFEDTNIEGWK